MNVFDPGPAPEENMKPAGAVAQRSRRAIWKRILSAAGAVGALTAAVLGIIGLVDRFSGDAAPSPSPVAVASSGVLESPADQARIGHQITVTGTVQRGDDQQQAWLVVQAGNRWYPGLEALRPDQEGNFSQEMYVGGSDDATDTRYTLQLITVDQAGVGVLDRYRQDQEASGAAQGLTGADLESAGSTVVHSQSLFRE